MDGKILKDEWGNQFKVSDQGTLVTDGVYGTWYKAHSMYNNDLQIVEEYPLTFEEALKEMLSGKKVENDCSFEYYRFFDGSFKCYHYEFESEWHDAELSITFQKAKWKVVE